MTHGFSVKDAVTKRYSVRTYDKKPDYSSSSATGSG